MRQWGHTLILFHQYFFDISSVSRYPIVDIFFNSYEMSTREGTSVSISRWPFFTFFKIFLKYSEEISIILKKVSHRWNLLQWSKFFFLLLSYFQVIFNIQFSSIFEYFQIFLNIFKYFSIFSSISQYFQVFFSMSLIVFERSSSAAVGTYLHCFSISGFQKLSN